jgi:hypothetical protein
MPLMFAARTDVLTTVSDHHHDITRSAVAHGRCNKRDHVVCAIFQRWRMNSLEEHVDPEVLEYLRRVQLRLRGHNPHSMPLVAHRCECLTYSREQRVLEHAYPLEPLTVHGDRLFD